MIKQAINLHKDKRFKNSKDLQTDFVSTTVFRNININQRNQHHLVFENPKPAKFADLLAIHT